MVTGLRQAGGISVPLLGSLGVGRGCTQQILWCAQPVLYTLLSTAPSLCWCSSCLLHSALEVSLSVLELILIGEDKLQFLSNDVSGTIPLHFIRVWRFFVKPEETVLINDHSEHLVFSLNNL